MNKELKTGFIPSSRKSSKKIMSALFLTFIFGLILLFASCTGSTDNSTSEDSLAEAAEEEKTADDGLAHDDVPELDFEGYEFKVVAGTYNLRNEDLFPQSEIGDVLNDTIYLRNKSIEGRFNITLKANTINLFELLATLRKNVKAGDASYDMYMQIDREAHTAAAENLLYQIDKLPYIDLSKPYWCRIPNKQLTINNKLFWAYSDDMLSFLEATVVTYYNKKKIVDLGLEDIYGFVRSGDWTHDKLFEYARIAVKDVNGDGEMDGDDNWGVASEHYYIAQSFWVSAGITLIGKDKDDMPYFAIPGNDKFFDIADRVINEFNSKDGLFMETLTTKNLAGYSGDSAMAKRLGFFRDGYVLFSVGAIPETIDLRDMPDDFGIVPFPKYNKEQPQYYSSVCGGFPFVIPSTIEKPEIAGAVMESMACEAKNRVIPAYYEMALKNKYSRDNDTAEMLDLIYETRVYDLGATIWSAPGTDYTYAFIAKTNTFASITEKNADKYNDIMNKAVEAILANLKQ